MKQFIPLPEFNEEGADWRAPHSTRRDLLESSKVSLLPEIKQFIPHAVPSAKLAAFVCDECARPLQLYGANFIESYSNGRVNILRCLCDLHADEMEVNG